MSAERRLLFFAEHVREITGKTNKLKKQRIEPQIRACAQAYKLQLEMLKHFVHEYRKDSTSWKTLGVQSLVSDPRVCSIGGPMCRWSLKARGSNDKAEFMRKPTRWLTSSTEIAEVLRGDGPWKRDSRYVRMTGMSETACEYPASRVVAMLSAIKCPMISDGAIRVGELHFAGLVPDEGDYPAELEGKWGSDGRWIDSKLLMEGRKEEMEHMRKIWVYSKLSIRKSATTTVASLSN